MPHLSYGFGRSLARAIATAAALTIFVAPALAAGPEVKFSLGFPESTMPTVFGSLPFPSDLYFDQGDVLDGDGTLINTGANIGLAADVVRNTNYTATLERGLDVLDGFGVTTGCFFFFNGPIDAASLPASPNLTPTPTDSVLMMNLSDGTLVPIALKANVDTRIPNVLAVIPVPGHVLEPQTRYACVVDGGPGGVTGGLMAVVPSADFVGARSGSSSNTDANDIYATAATTVAANGGPPVSEIAGMAVYTTMSTTESLRRVQVDVLPSLPVPTADLSSAPLIFKTGTKNDLDDLFGPVSHANLSIVATGYFTSPRFQTNDPNGNGPVEDLPNTASLALACNPGTACEPNDEVFVYTSAIDKTPIIQNAATTIPFTVTIPSAPPPVGGYPIIINQHGLGGDRKLVADLADVLAAEGFASIGIDAVAHGYRYRDPSGTSRPNLQDASNNFGGTAVPDGFADGNFLVFTIGAASTQLGFFQGFNNIIGAGDNFRQTCADLMQLVRLIQSTSIDGALGVNIDESNIFYMGHSLGGIMGSCLAAFEPDIKAYLVNATGGGLVSELLLNSSIGAGALSSLNTIFTLDPANVADHFSLFANFGQTLIDRADPSVEGGHWVQNPIVGGARNVMQISDDSDEVVPNQANEALGIAAGLEIFVPYVQNLRQHPESLPLVGTVGTVTANGPGGTTAFYLQQGTATHAATVSPFVGALSFVPGHAIVSEWPNAFPSYERAVRVQNRWVLPNVLDWFNDIVASGTPGTFDYTEPPNFNPIDTTNVPTGASGNAFFARTVSGGSLAAFSEPTSDVIVDLTSNSVASRLSADRSILGTTDLANSDDMPPGIAMLANGALPFFTTVQKSPEGTFSANLTIVYTADDLARAAIVDGSPDEAGLKIVRFGGPGTCLVSGSGCATSANCVADTGPCVNVLSTTVDTLNNEVTTTGLTDFSIFGVVNDAIFAHPVSIPGKGSPTAECAVEFLVSNPAGANVLDGAGNPSHKQACQDGDPSCDFDGTVGQCTFQAALCFNVVDNRFPNCVTDQINFIDLKNPSAKQALKTPEDLANRNAITGLTQIALALPDARDNDCAPFNVIVKMKPDGDGGFKATKYKVKLKATFLQTLPSKPQSKKTDTDKLELTCTPS